MNIWEFYVNYVSEEDENNNIQDDISILSSYEYNEQEAIAFSQVNKEKSFSWAFSQYQENETLWNNNKIEIMLYILIFIFSLILVVLILRKESLL
jgi:hypothetical protein